jgi:SAM-dependent methyltransferase
LKKTSIGYHEKLRSLVPQQVKNCFYDLSDLTARSPPLTPPLKLRKIIGQKTAFFENRVPLLLENCEFRNDSTILDVGCGCGSLPVSLIKYSTYSGQYFGFDIVKDFITWLSNTVSKSHDNFHFFHSDVWNSSYNPKGKIAASKYRFPLPSNYFDIIFLGSVFTHMLPEDLENYLTEITRCLKPNGICFITYFLKENLSNNSHRMKFFATEKNYEVADLNVPEKAVAYPQDYILGLYSKRCLKLTKPIKYDFQDLIVAQKVCV